MANWRSADEDVRRVFDEQNPWHRNGQIPDVLARSSERALGQRLWQRLEREDVRRFQLVLGPRRVGKSTVMYQTVRHLLAEGYGRRQLWWLRLDHPLLLRESLGDLVRTIVDERSNDETIVLFLDELVYAREWDLWLKTFYDDGWPVQIVASSSATAALADRRRESGVGRWDEQYLLPYQFSEYLDLRGVEAPVQVAETLEETFANVESLHLEDQALETARVELLLTGGFPELLVRPKQEHPDGPTRLLESQQTLRADAVERAIYKDIPQSFGIQDTMMLERLLYVLASQVTGLLSPTNIGKELGLSNPTFSRYLSYLEQAFLIFTLPNYSGNESSVQRRGRKLYFTDGAVRNAALQRGIAPLRNTVEMGTLTENMAASHLHALARQTGVRLFHWRDKNDEVDLVYDHPSGPSAFEIGSSSGHPQAGMRAFIQRYPKFKAHCWVVTPDATYADARRSRSGIGTLSLDAFLLAVGRQSETALADRLGTLKGADNLPPTLFQP